MIQNSEFMSIRTKSRFSACSTPSLSDTQSPGKRRTQMRALRIARMIGPREVWRIGLLEDIVEEGSDRWYRLRASKP